MSDHEYDFGYGEQFLYSLYRADEVSSARQEPGVYAWYVRTPLAEAAEASCDPYRKVFAERRFQMQASAPLGERLIGSLDREQPPLTPRVGQDLDEQLFANAFAVFAPPIYIGRSSSIQTRLKKHLAALNIALAKGAIGDPDDIAPADSDDESAQFGSRIGALLRSRGVFDHRGLFVKIIYATNNTATKRVEFILNRTFHPTLGRL